jgi:hypothetical protein
MPTVLPHLLTARQNHSRGPRPALVSPPYTTPIVCHNRARRQPVRPMSAQNAPTTTADSRKWRTRQQFILALAPLGQDCEQHLSCGGHSHHGSKLVSYDLCSCQVDHVKVPQLKSWGQCGSTIEQLWAQHNLVKSGKLTARLCKRREGRRPKPPERPRPGPGCLSLAGRSVSFDCGGDNLAAGDEALPPVLMGGDQ